MLNQPVSLFLLLSVLLHLTPGFGADAARKLHGPVTNFIRGAQNGQMRFSADPSLKIGYIKWPATEKGNVPLVIIPGRGEIAYLWAETAYDLMELGYAGDIYVWDPPGQGLSDRLLPEMPGVGHIDQFSDYSTSLVEFLKTVRKESGRLPHVMAHSMGGAVALNALEAAPNLARDLVLVTPMLDIRFGPPLVDRILTVLVGVLDRFPFLRKIAFNRGPPKPLAPMVKGTSLGDRLEFRVELKSRYDGFVPGKTLHWVAEANRGISEALRHADRLSLPILLFTGGKDTVVEYSGDASLQQQCQKNCHIERIENSSHSMHEESDATRAQFILKVADWYKLGGVNEPELCERLLLKRN